MKPPRTYVWSVRLLSALSAAALFMTGELQISVALVFVSLFVIGLPMEKHPRLLKAAGFAQPFFALLVFGLAVVDFIYLSNSFLLSVAHFLLFIQGLRLLAIATVRDGVGSVMLSSLMMLSASTLSVDWTFFLMLVVFLGLAIWSVLWANLADEHEEITGSALDETSGLWQRLLPAVRHSTFAAFLLAATACAVVFVLFPRLNLQGFRGQYLQPVRKTGFTNQVELRAGGRISEDKTIVMRVEVDQAERNRWDGYLRGAALDYFDGVHWRRTQSQVKRVHRDLKGIMPLSYERRAGARTMRQSIYLESMDTTLLFAALRPTWVQIDQPFVEVGEDFSVSRRAGNSWRTHYDVESYLPDSRAYPDRLRKISSSHLEVKGISRSELARLSADIVGSEKDPRRIAQRIESALQARYAYSLDLGEAIKGNPLEIFLFQRKKGHCEYFAAAMCLLLRENGIPSRMATGFRAHEWNDRGGYYIVRMRDAHAWVEAHISREGWMSFDPSPRDFTGEFDGGWMRRVDEFMDYLNLQWNRQILSYDLERQIGFVKSIGSGSQRMTIRFEGLRSLWRRKPGEKLLGPDLKGLPWIPVAGVFAGIVAIIIVFRRRRQKSPVWFYAPFLKTLETLGGPKPEGKTIAEFVDELSAKLGPKKAAADELSRAYYSRRFGGDTVDDTRIRHALTDLRRR